MAYVVISPYRGHAAEEHKDAVDVEGKGEYNAVATSPPNPDFPRSPLPCFDRRLHLFLVFTFSCVFGNEDSDVSFNLIPGSWSPSLLLELDDMTSFLEHGL